MLQSCAGEIDRCLKKVQEGVEAFEEIWKKVCLHHWYYELNYMQHLQCHKKGMSSHAVDLAAYVIPHLYFDVGCGTGRYRIWPVKNTVTTVFLPHP